MGQQYGDDFITITDEDGVEYELEVLATLEYQGVEYPALIPAEDSEETEELEVSILKSVEEDGEEVLLAIEDPNELETVYGLFMDQMYEEDSQNSDADSL